MTAAQTISCRHKSDFNYRTCSFFLFLLCLLLFGTPSRSLAVDYNRSWRTVMGFYPRPGSLAAALIAWSPGQRGLWLDGSIMIGSSGHCGMALPQAIFRTDLTRSAPLMSSYWQNTRNPAGGLRVSFCAAFRFRAEQLTYRNRWICNFQGATGTEKIPFTSIKEKVKGSTTSKVNI